VPKGEDTLKLLGARMVKTRVVDHIDHTDHVHHIDHIADGRPPVGRRQDDDERTDRVVEFDELYRREYRPLVALAYGLSGSRGAAEEIVQDAFMAAHRRWPSISSYDMPSMWLRRVVANRSASTVRRRVAEARALTRVATWANRPDPLPEQHDELWRAVRRLPPQQAKALLLRYVDDRTVAETASILGCSEGTAKTHLHRARRSLAGALPQHAPRRTKDD
jgi:RNA polymerase sigma-70 factor (sigma-E family)